MMPGALAYLTGAARQRSQVHVVIPLFPFAPFVQSLKTLADILGILCSDIAGRPKHLNRAPIHPVEVERDVNNGAHWLYHHGEFPQLPEGFCSFPAFSSQSLSLICCSEATHSVFIFLTGVIDLYIHAHLCLLMGGGVSIILLCHHHFF